MSTGDVARQHKRSVIGGVKSCGATGRTRGRRVVWSAGFLNDAIFISFHKFNSAHTLMIKRRVISMRAVLNEHVDDGARTWTHLPISVYVYRGNDAVRRTRMNTVRACKRSRIICVYRTRMHVHATPYRMGSQRCWIRTELWQRAAQHLTLDRRRGVGSDDETSIFVAYEPV